MRRVARDHVFVEQGHRADGEADPNTQSSWQKPGVLEMKKIGGSLLVAFLSFWSLGSSPGYAAACYPTQSAMAVVENYGLKPLVLKGQYAQQFVPAGLKLNTVDFAAMLFDKNGNAFVFFGNVATTCGPYQLNKKQVIKFLRPA